MAQGHGVIFATLHLGAPGAAGHAVTMRGTPVNVLVEQLHPPALHQFVAELRAALGYRMLVADRGSLRATLAALRRNEIVGILCDRDVAGTGELLPFFCKETRVTTAAATLARRTGAVILPTVVYRTGIHRGNAAMWAPIEVPHTADVADDVRQATLRI